MVKKISDSDRLEADNLMQEAKEEGVEEGKKQERETVAKNLLSLGMDNEFVIKATGLDKPEIEKLKTTLHLSSE